MSNFKKLLLALLLLVANKVDAVKQKLMNSKDNQEDNDRVSRKLGKYNSIIHKIKEVEKSLEMEKYSQDHVVFDSQQQ